MLSPLFLWAQIPLPWADTFKKGVGITNRKGIGLGLVWDWFGIGFGIAGK
jgi:hypothetical protein